jgi:ABC-type uncharacterized transport system substrate-binding protein
MASSIRATKSKRAPADCDKNVGLGVEWLMLFDCPRGKIMLHYNIMKSLASKILRPFKNFLFIACCGLLLLKAMPAQAHPHAWVDVQSEILFDASGNIKGLRETWLFDEFYSEFAVQDFNLVEKGEIQTEKLVKLGIENLNNLKEYNYFTTIYSDKASVKILGYQDVTSDLPGKRIRLSFTLPLEKPINPRQHQVSYQIYDPSYYAEIKHAGNNSVTLKNNPGCTARLDPPKPSMEFVTLAAALDKNATGPDDLGSAFAERVTLNCQAKQQQ